MKNLKKLFLALILFTGMFGEFLPKSDAYIAPVYNRWLGTDENGIWVCHCDDSGTKCRCVE